MTRTWRWIVLLVIAMMMGGIAVWSRAHRAMESYTTFTSQHLKVRFDYPSGWQAQEMIKPAGQRLGEVQIFGPVRKELAHSPYVDVSAAPAAAAGGRPVTLEDAVRSVLTRRQQQPSYRILEEKPVRCAGQSALRVYAGFQLSLPLRSVHRKPVAFLEEVTYLLHDGQLFRLA